MPLSIAYPYREHPLDSLDLWAATALQLWKKSGPLPFPTVSEIWEKFEIKAFFWLRRWLGKNKEGVLLRYETITTVVYVYGHNKMSFVFS